MRGFTSYEAGQDTRVGTERRPRLKKRDGNGSPETGRHRRNGDLSREFEKTTSWQMECWPKTEGFGHSNN
jgi:hypothetical protein